MTKLLLLVCLVYSGVFAHDLLQHILHAPDQTAKMYVKVYSELLDATIEKDTDRIELIRNSEKLQDMANLFADLTFTSQLHVYSKPLISFFKHIVIHIKKEIPAQKIIAGWNASPEAQQRDWLLDDAQAVYCCEVLWNRALKTALHILHTPHLDKVRMPNLDHAQKKALAQTVQNKIAWITTKGALKSALSRNLLIDHIAEDCRKSFNHQFFISDAHLDNVTAKVCCSIVHKLFSAWDKMISDPRVVAFIKHRYGHPQKYLMQS